MDLRMLVYMGGRERTPAELAALAERAGLRPSGTRHVGDYRTIIELVGTGGTISAVA